MGALQLKSGLKVVYKWILNGSKVVCGRSKKPENAGLNGLKKLENMIHCRLKKPET